MKTELSLLLILLLLIGGCDACYQLGTVDHATITVKRGERVNKHKSSYYLVWTEQNEVFTVDDAFFHGHFNSSDLYGQLESGRKFDVKVYGWRIPFFSEYRNIIAIEKSY
jgi:hypothetical protein